MKRKIIGGIVLLLLAIATVVIVVKNNNPFARNSLSSESKLPDGGGLITIDKLPQPVPPAAEAGEKVVTSPNTELDVQHQENEPILDLIAPLVATSEGEN